MLVHPLADPLQNAAVAKCAAFSRTSMAPVVGDATARECVLGQAVEPAQVIAVFDGDTVAGLLGFTIDGRDFTRVRLWDFQRFYGRSSGVLRYIAYNYIKSLYYGPDLYIAAFWVDPERRGGGYGQQILTRLRVIATERKMRIWTDVKIGNAAAFRFYEKHGFQRQKGFLFSSLLPRIKGYERVFWEG